MKRRYWGMAAIAACLTLQFANALGASTGAHHNARTTDANIGRPGGLAMQVWNREVQVFGSIRGNAAAAHTTRRAEPIMLAGVGVCLFVGVAVLAG